MRRIALAVLLALSLAGCGKMFGFRRGDLPEPPPDWATNLGPAPGYHVQQFNSLKALSDWCQAWGVKVPDADNYNNRTTEACVVRPLKAVGVPTLGAVNGDQTLYNALLSHEDFHTYGVDHAANDRGWYLNAPPPSDIDPKVASLLMTLPKAPQFAMAQPNALAQKPMTATPKPPGLMGSSARQ